MYMKHVWKKPKALAPKPVQVPKDDGSRMTQQKLKSNQDFLGRPLKTPLSSLFKNV